jgi:hypothetical protein
MVMVLFSLLSWWAFGGERRTRLTPAQRRRARVA